MINCKNCGKQTALLHNRCEHCGHEMKICKECGNVEDINAKACSYCGLEFQTEQQEKEVQAKNQIDEARKKADELLILVNKKNKLYQILMMVFVFIAIIPIMIAYNQILHIENSYNFYLNALASIASFKIWFIISSIFVLIAVMFDFFKIPFMSGKISRYADMNKFDYKTYYKNIATDKKGNIYTTLGQPAASADITLANVMSYRYNPSNKTKKVLWGFLFMIITCMGLIFIGKGLSESLARYVILLSSSPNKFVSILDVFNLNTSLIIGLVLFLVVPMFKPIIDNDKARVRKFVKSIKYQG